MPILHGVAIPEIYREWRISLDRQSAGRGGYNIWAVAWAHSGERLNCEWFISDYELQQTNVQSFIHYVLRRFLLGLDELIRDHFLANPDDSFRLPVPTITHFAPARINTPTTPSGDSEQRVRNSLPPLGVSLDNRIQGFQQLARAVVSIPLIPEPTVTGVDPAQGPDQSVSYPPKPKQKKSKVQGKLSRASNPATLKVVTKVRKLRLPK
jgi:hypothetical protein